MRWSNAIVVFIALLLLRGATPCAVGGTVPIYKNPNAPVQDRVDDLLSRLTLDEKIELVGGNGLETEQNERLGIPPILMTDGPQGVRGTNLATVFPANIATIATWNPELMKEVAAGIARDAKAAGRNMILGPCVSMNRVPRSGRNFECGAEDPYLNSRFAENYVQGMKSERVLSSTKHFALNDQEENRKTIDVKADERTMREIELPPYEAAIRAGTDSVMMSYNKVNGVFATENPELIQDILRKQMGFDGIVLSDWESVHSTGPAANSGLDLEMPNGEHFGEQLKKAVESGEVKASVVDDQVRHILGVMFKSGVFDHPPHLDESQLDSALNRHVALLDAQESIVLLQNKGSLLPLSGIRSVAVIGPSAAFAHDHGGGSGGVVSFHSESPLDALSAAFPSGIKIRYAEGARIPEQFENLSPKELRTPDGRPGLQAEYFKNLDLRGTPAVTRIDPGVNLDLDWHDPAPGVSVEHFSARWTGKFISPFNGAVTFGFGAATSNFRLYVDGKLFVDAWDDPMLGSAVLYFKKGETHDIRFEFRHHGEWNPYPRLSWMGPSPKIENAVKIARESDVAIVFAGNSDSTEEESKDRDSLRLPGLQDELIREVAKANPRTVVVLEGGGPILVGRWRSRVPAILDAWFPGEEGAKAIADVLTGQINPSGKLPVTFPKNESDSPSSAYYPGDGHELDYSKAGIFEGYRGYDKSGTKPEFEFGYGLSYSRFIYGKPDVKVFTDTSGPHVTVALEIKNIGRPKGAEVVQLYVRPLQPSVSRPFKELKGFQKITLEPGATGQISFNLNQDAFSYFDSNSHSWKLDPGPYELLVGTSSARVVAKAKVMVPGAQS